ncbi:hypothetical protein C7212DRAFT_304357 [Tuber magnatum]|uniref:Uncharacterized protein n=1 Tax=Tuber magnatum TaxID=42249 RepID=A0A317T1M0_9PEZI|nr:hypothetical protein C7212DRAFT_304357 [Tuber magnatum]
MQGEEKVEMEKQERVERRNRRGIQEREGETEGMEYKGGKGKGRGGKERKKRVGEKDKDSEGGLLGKVFGRNGVE